MIIVIPEYVLIKGFIIRIWGKEYLLSDLLTFLLILDQYLVLVQDCNGVLLSVTGHFRELKVADGVAAISNIFLSVFFARIWGIEGVFWGTIASRMLQWGFKGYYSHLNYWKESRLEFTKYWIENIFKFGFAMAGAFVSAYLTGFISVELYLIDFIFKGIISVFISLGFALIYGILSGQFWRFLSVIKGR